MDRRSFIKNIFGCGIAATSIPIQAFGKTPDNEKLIVILLRGALDGLAAFPPFGDPYLDQVRGSLVNQDDYSNLSSFFGIHNSLPEFKKLYQQKQALLFHAVSMPDNTRSHFEMQDSLEQCSASSDTGWLGRSMQYNNMSAIGVGNTVPKILWGNNRSTSWKPKKSTGADEEFYEVGLLLSENDYAIHQAVSDAWDIKVLTEEAAEEDGNNIKGNSAVATARGVSQLLMHSTGSYSIENSPDCAVLSIGGWDTHNRQIPRLRNNLKVLDNTIKTLRQEFAPIWDKTTILVTTEFGRTARENGAGGTDHGNGSVALLAGGRIQGGKTYADWPGLNNLNEDRDLKTTIDLQNIFSSVAHHVLKVPRSQLYKVFPLQKQNVVYNIFT